MSNIIVTYFEPFGGRTTNASKEVVSLLSGYQIKELPVSWSKISSCLDEILIDEPDYLFLIGEAGSYKEITMERTAHNISFGKDNEGVNKDNEEIISGDKESKTTLFVLSKLPYNYSKYLTTLGPERCRANGYHLTEIKNEFEATYLKDLNNLKSKILSEFKVGERYLKSDIKEKLREIYTSESYSKTPKANDLEDYFEVKGCLISKDGKKSAGFEILKEKK
jgi:hypothetical protein